LGESGYGADELRDYGKHHAQYGDSGDEGEHGENVACEAGEGVVNVLYDFAQP